VKKQAAVSQNAFAGQKTKPTEKALRATLGSSFEPWKQLVAEMKRDLKIDVVEWHTTSIKYGWALRLQLKKRNIVYLSPRQDYFMATFVLGGKAVALALASDLPAALVKNISGSRPYAEGTAVYIEMRTTGDIEAVKKLAKIKIEN
jgi:hypothetical protein